MHDSVKAYRHDSEVVSMHKYHSSEVHVRTESCTSKCNRTAISLNDANLL